ncbi:MAG: putative toxin-antitoxin system toxin component, PIN family [Planctomycetes bacterium]|nr:putative toxin-antitoxin system toxin component, PIN family [Planctomycetota bacterium]
MKIFFDTNVLIAVFITRGASNELFEHCISEHIIYISEQVVNEFRTNLAGKFHFSENEISHAVKFLRKNAVIVVPLPLSGRVSRDPDDDNIIAGAVAGKADCLITGDWDILALKSFQGIPILKPADFWKFEKERT